MISQTQTASNQYGFYAVPKKLQPKKKYRQSQYEDFYDSQQNVQNNFHEIQRNKIPQHNVQRDFYVDQAPYPQFKPKQRGLDYGVQIQKGDLFDYELQVQPLLEILVGRSVVSAINQLQQEKQKVQKRQKLQTYQKKRNAQLMVTQRLEAKSKRKIQQSQRRVLQKQIYVKNQKQAGKKLIARKSAKQNLLGLKNELLSELQEDGFLRSQMYTNLRIDYQGWLYEQITSLIKQDKKITVQVQRMINDVQKQDQDQHKKKIAKQKKRRQQILDQRQRIKKLNQEKKQKKRIKKQRLQLNGQRQPHAIKLDELLQKYHQVEHILKFQSRSSGFNTNPGNTLYISGGLMNFVIAILNSTQKTYTQDETQQILTKLIAQSATPLQFQFSEQHYNLIQQVVEKMNQNPNNFMKDKQQKVEELKSRISLSLKLLQLANTNIKQSLHEALLGAILNILLTNTNIIKPQGQQGQLPYEPTQKDKAREQLKKKLNLSVFKQNLLEQIQIILRIRFQRKYPEQDSKKSQRNQPSQDQWVDIYDGQGWNHHCKQYPEQNNRQSQKPAAINIPNNTFERSYIYDERSLHFLKRQIENVLEIQSGPQAVKYVEELANLNYKIKKDIPIYDGEVRIQ